MGNATSRFAAFCISKRRSLLCILVICTIGLGYCAAHIQVKTIFSDMLPLNHPWVKTNEKYKKVFGGANRVSIMVKARQGTIFRRSILETIEKVTQDLKKVDSVNPMTITSLASRKLKTVEASSHGVKTMPLMGVHVPENKAQMKTLKTRVLQDPLAYGRYVSRDLGSALITASFYERSIDYKKIFPEINSIVQHDSNDQVQMYVVGQPMLYGWVRHYLPQTVLIAAITIGLLALLLFLLNRSYRGTIFPLISGALSAVWAVGIGELLGFNFDPLIVVVAFLITARSISHSVQQVTRFDDLIAADPQRSSADAARRSLRELFRPGSVGILVDAAAMLVVLLTPIPLLQKVAIIGAIWVGTIFVSAIMLTPILLSLIKRPNHHAHRLDLETGMRWLLGWCFRVTTGKPRYLVVGIAVAIFVVSGLLAFQVTVGDAHSGSPILRPNSVYNRSAAAINSHYPGANRMFVVVHGDQKGALRKPAVLKNMAQFQRDMAIQPEVGGTESLKDVIAATNQSLHGGDPRYYDIANTARRNGQFLYIYFSHSAESAIRQYADPKYQNAAITLFFQNHTGKTIRTAFHNIQQYISNHPMKHASYELAGGFIGVMAAVNNVLLRGQMEAVALGLLVVVLCAMLVYRSTAAGLYFMAPVLLSNTVTFAYMSFNHIGLNINTVPVVALGIGLGVDYSFYIADGIRDQLREHGNVKLAIQGSLFSAGRGVFVTGLTLVATVFLWTFSSLRFQAEMAKLIALWLSVSAISALILMPAIAYIFRPRFIFGGQGDSGQEGVEESGIRTASE